MVQIWSQNTYVEFSFDCLTTPKDRCKDKWFKDDNFHDENDFEECYEFIIKHKFDFCGLFAKSLKRKYPEVFN